MLVIGFLLTPIIARIYGPEAYGQFAIFTALASIVQPISTFQLPTGYVASKNIKQLSAVIKITLLTLIFSSILLLVLVFLLKSADYTFKLGSEAMLFLPFYVFITGTKQRSEKVIITVAIFSFLVHLALILFKDFLPGNLALTSSLFKNPIAAIYTPFSFILLYEVYLLVYYLPKSISLYISKQYEIITLVIIRRIFKDLANLDLNSNWFENSYDLQLTFDLVTTLFLFGLILLFNKLNQNRKIIRGEVKETSNSLSLLIRRKKILAILLVPVFVTLALYSFGTWIADITGAMNGGIQSLGDVNLIFFNEFFTILILADVLLLLFSFFHMDQFNAVIRNSGFIISTILIRLSFSTTGLVNDLLVVVAVTFGVLILWINNKYYSLK